MSGRLVGKMLFEIKVLQIALVDKKVDQGNSTPSDMSAEKFPLSRWGAERECRAYADTGIYSFGSSLKDIF